MVGFSPSRSQQRGMSTSLKHVSDVIVWLWASSLALINQTYSKESASNLLLFWTCLFVKTIPIAPTNFVYLLPWCCKGVFSCKHHNPLLEPVGREPMAIVSSEMLREKISQLGLAIWTGYFIKIFSCVLRTVKIMFKYCLFPFFYSI